MNKHTKIKSKFGKFSSYSDSVKQKKSFTSHSAGKDKKYNENSNQSKNDRTLEKYRLTIGLHSVLEAIKIRPNKIVKIFLRQSWNTSEDLRKIYDLAHTKRIPVEEKNLSFFDRLSNTNQGVAAYLSETPAWVEETAINSTHSIIVGMDGIEDPHNLGAVIRTAWLFGVDGIMIPEDRAVGLTPTVHKVASGGVEHVPILQTNSFSNKLDLLKKSGFWVFGLDAEGERELFDLKLPEKVIWLIGAEDKGLRVTSKKQCDELIRIPQIYSGASYNASVAASIAISETYRQHQIKKK